MRVLRWSLLVVLIGGLTGAAYLHWRKDTVKPVVPEATAADLDGRAVRITGPHSHENLTVFLVHSDAQDERDFLTLDEGLTKGLVKIAELEQEQVGQLHVDNQSDRPLYLQEGERLQGGKQDRIIAATVVLPPHSGKAAVPSFCIEQSRWTEGDKGRSFGYTLNSALAPKGVRGAAKFENDQQSIWKAVAVQKGTGKSLALADNTNSSANELLDAPRVRKLSDACVEALVGVLKEQADVIGFAVVLNGQIEEVNVYPNSALLGKLYPRLLRSYALQAVMLKGQKDDAETTATDVVSFLKTEKEVSSKNRVIDRLNEAQIRELSANRFQCTTRHQGQPVHWQLMKQNAAEVVKASGEKVLPPSAAMRVQALGSKW